MSILDIKVRPNPVLRRKCLPVKVVDDKTRRLLDDMLETMYKAPGVGLAAPQIGVNKRLIVVDVGDEGQGPWKLANPRIVMASEEEELGPEGCLSCPGVIGDVWRSLKITVRALDYDGNTIEFDAEGFEARCFQHEIDHLDGHLFVEKAEDMRTPEEEAARLQKEAKESEAECGCACGEADCECSHQE